MKRGRNQRRRQGMNINRALDSNGPDVRIRGTANQIYDKYQSLARDATSSGDRVKAENYLQHAEHYFRLIRSMQAQNGAQSNAQNAHQPQNNSPVQEAASEEQPDIIEKQPVSNGAGDDAPAMEVTSSEDGKQSEQGQASEEEKAPPRTRRRRSRQTQASDGEKEETETPRKRSTSRKKKAASPKEDSDDKLVSAAEA